MKLFKNRDDIRSPQEIADQIIWNRWKRKWIKRLTPDEVLAPFIGSLLITFVVVLLTAKLHGVI